METIQIMSVDAIEAMNRSEVDVQIKTAKAYPRDIAKSLERIEQYATSDQETAEDCHYSLPRDGKMIEGPSVRFAEICANAWGNMRIGTRLLSNDGSTITVQGICHDLETNVAYMDETHLSILKRDGKQFSKDMQITTAKRGASVALRNAIFRAIPEHMTKKIQEKVRKVAIGKALDLPAAIEKMMSSFKKIGITEEQIFIHLDVKDRSGINADKLHVARGTWNAIKDGAASVDDVFPKTAEEKVKEKKDAIKDEKKKATKPGEQSALDMK